MGRRARSNQLRHRQNPYMKAYAEKYPTPRDQGGFGRDFVKESAKTGKPFCLSISFQGTPQARPTGSSFSTRYTRAKNSPSRSIMAGSGKHFFFKANRAGNTNASSAGGTVTNTTRSWQSLPSNGTRCGWPLVRSGSAVKEAAKNTVFTFYHRFFVVLWLWLESLVLRRIDQRSLSILSTIPATLPVGRICVPTP